VRRETFRVEAGVGDIAATTAGDFHLSQHGGRFLEDENLRTRCALRKGNRSKEPGSPSPDRDKIVMIHVLSRPEPDFGFLETANSFTLLGSCCENIKEL
jgi:hypothetical protein